MVKYFPEAEDRLVGHELHGNCFHRYELRDVYLSDVVRTNVERNLKSGYLDVGIHDGLIRILEKELSFSKHDLDATDSQVKDFKDKHGYVSNGLRRKRLRFELKEQVYRNSLSALED
ncbi:MAG: hypothetical protein ACLFTR_04840 [Candidatus Woesearchaeota archaeon]